MIAHRPDWTISRQRVWGVPIVAFYCEGCGTPPGRRAPRRARGRASCATGEGADEWYARAAARAAAGGHPLRQVRRRGASARRRTSSTSGSTRAAATPPCCETRPDLRWPAEHVPRRLGPAPRLVPLLAAGGGGHADRPRLQGGADPRLRGGRRRAQDVQVAAATTWRPRSSSRSTAPRCCGCGSPPRTTPRTSASPTRS